MIPSIDQMNSLQAAGIISDNCVSWDDVCAADQERAAAWLAARCDFCFALLEKCVCNGGGGAL